MLVSRADQISPVYALTIDLVQNVYGTCSDSTQIASFAFLDDRHALIPVWTCSGNSRQNGVAVVNLLHYTGDRITLSDAMAGVALVLGLPQCSPYHVDRPGSAGEQEIHVSLECRPPTPVFLNEMRDIFVRDPAAGASILLVRMEGRRAPGYSGQASIVLRTSTLLNRIPPATNQGRSSTSPYILPWHLWAHESRILDVRGARLDVLATKLVYHRPYSWQTIGKLSATILDFDTAPSLAKDLSSASTDTSTIVIEPTAFHPRSIWNEKLPSRLLYRQDVVHDFVLSGFDQAVFGEDFVLVSDGASRYVNCEPSLSGTISDCLVYRRVLYSS